ncbi:MAG: hypothetical protein EBT45_07500 [Alphaproteobacteria bacterium]|nr:hypothetical protein [Alphaproteobacteria bacterium]
MLEQNQVHSENNNILILENPLERSLLSYAQERLWFIEQFEEGTSAYNIPMIFSLSSETNLEVLEKSIKSIVSRHEILRTVIKVDYNNVPWQYIVSAGEGDFRVLERFLNCQEDLDRELRLEANYVFDLSEEYPIRASIFKVDSTGLYYLSVVIHHIAFDGWSVDIFLKELGEYYKHYLTISRGLTSELGLSKLRIHYKDFAIWQKSYISGEKLQEQLEYWKRKLDGFEDLNLLPDKPRPKQFDYQGRDISFTFGLEVSRTLRQIAKDLRVSLFSLLLSAYYIMLSVYSRQRDIIIGTPVANRHYSEVESIIGFFVNSLALRMRIDPQMEIKNYVRHVSEEVIQAQIYQDLPFEMLVGEIIRRQDTSKHPIFQILFVVQSFGHEVNSERGTKEGIGCLLKPYEKENEIYNIARFDISTYIDDSEENIKGRFNYASSIYDDSTIKAMIVTYKHILEQFASLLSTNTNHTYYIAHVVPLSLKTLRE